MKKCISLILAALLLVLLSAAPALAQSSRYTGTYEQIMDSIERAGIRELGRTQWYRTFRYTDGREETRRIRPPRGQEFYDNGLAVMFELRIWL